MSRPSFSFYVPSFKNFCLFYNESAKIVKIHFSTKEFCTSKDY